MGSPFRFVPPPRNCRNAEQLDSWLLEMSVAPSAPSADETGRRLRVGLSQPDRAPLERPPRRGSRGCTQTRSRGRHHERRGRRACSRPLHDAGALAFADVASIRHAERAIEAGADGLVLLSAGAGGQTGWLNPFAFTRAVRRFFLGTDRLSLAASAMDALCGPPGRSDAISAYMGTRFNIATHEKHGPTNSVQGYAGGEQRR